MAMQQLGNKQGRWQDRANLMLGGWLILAPFIGIGANLDVAAWNSSASGAVVAVFAIVAIARPQLWEEWLNLMVGLWLIVAPFALSYTHQPGPMWNQIIVGLLIGVDALWVGAQTWTQHRHA